MLTKGRPGETCLVGADGERDNITVMRDILRTMVEPEDAFDWVRDLPDHDRRYAIDSSKQLRELDWTPPAPTSRRAWPPRWRGTGTTRRGDDQGQ